MPYIGVSPQFGVRRKHTYTATAGQTSFSGAGSEGATLSYTDSNFVDVYQNGVKLGDADYTSTSGTAIVLAQGASVDDLVEIIVFDAFSAADTVSKADGGTFDNAITVAKDGATALTVDRATSDGAIVDLQKDGTSIGNIGIASSTNDIFINSVASNHKGLRFGSGAIVPTTNSAGTDDNATALGGATQRFSNLYLGGGIYIGGTGSANLLDDYEEGTFTPIYEGSSSDPTITYNTDSTVGAYVKIGELVHVQGRIRTNATSGGSGNLLLGGLPFTSYSGSNYYAGFTIAYSRYWSSDNFPIALYTYNGTTTAFLSHGREADLRDGIGILVTTADLTNGTNSNDIIFTGTYRID